LPRLTPARIIFSFTALVVVYFLFAFAFNAIRGHQLSAQEDRLQAEIADLQSRHDRLVALEQYLKSDEYIEEVAREQLGYVKQGEIGFIAISSQPTPTPEPGALPELWWDTLIR
jgi:cell division protein FtsB